MDIVVKNPYRVLGLPAGASTREITRQTSTLKRYLDADAVPPADFSCAALDNFRRTAADIDAAVAHLNLDEDKMLAALFWFWKGNDITDEPALDALKDNNHFEATDIWEKLIVTGIVTERNASAFNNISTFNLLAASCNKTLAINFIKDAIEKKIKFLDSDFYRKLVTSVTDSTYKTTGKKLQLLFLKKIVEQIERNQLPQIIRHINTFDFAAKAEFLKSVSQQFSANITTQVETARRTRTTDKQHAAVAGNNLNKNTKDDLAQLKEIFGTTDFSYSNTADKVANEILQCGIDFFNHYKDNSLDPGDLTMSVFKTAKAIAVGNATKQRCDENIKVVQEWIESKPEREKMNLIKDEFDMIMNKMNEYKKKSHPISDAVAFVNSCLPYLGELKKKLGKNDKLYLNISTSVCNIAQETIVSNVNRAMEKWNAYVKWQNNNSLIRL